MNNDHDNENTTETEERNNNNEQKISRKDRLKIIFIGISLIALVLFGISKCVDLSPGNGNGSGLPTELPLPPSMEKLPAEHDREANPFADPLLNPPPETLPKTPLTPGKTTAAPSETKPNIVDQAAPDESTETENRDNADQDTTAEDTSKVTESSTTKPAEIPLPAEKTKDDTESAQPATSEEIETTPTASTDDMAALLAQIEQLNQKVNGALEQITEDKSIERQSVKAQMQAACPDCRPVEHVLLDLGYLQQVLQQILAVQQAAAAVNPKMHPVIRNIIKQEYPRLQTLIPATFSSTGLDTDAETPLTVDQVSTMIKTTINEVTGQRSRTTHTCRKDKETTKNGHASDR